MLSVSSAVTDESKLPEWVEFLLQGRPDRVTTALLSVESPEVRRAVRDAQETLAALALLEEPVAPSAELRDRIVKSVEGRFRLARERKAILVIDMLNDHLTPGGALEVPRARDVVPALRTRLEAARAAGMPVVYVCDEHDPDDPDLDEWTTHNVKGTKGAEVWPDLAPESGDRTVHKHTYSAFTGSNLEAVLDELRVDTLVVTGCLTEIGLLATATDALQRGFAVEVPPDSQAGASLMAEQAALHMLSVMPPYGAARRERLARLQAA
jgi:nicotinamidase-related amidase